MNYSIKVKQLLHALVQDQFTNLNILSPGDAYLERSQKHKQRYDMRNVTCG